MSIYIACKIYIYISWHPESFVLPFQILLQASLLLHTTNLVTVTHEILIPFSTSLVALFKICACRRCKDSCYFVPKTLETVVERYCTDFSHCYFHAVLSA